jgi:hypothetical protein
MDLTALSQRFAHQGALLLRQVLDPAHLTPWLRHAEQAYSLADRAFAAETLDPSYQRGLYGYGHLSPEDSQPPDGLPPEALVAPLHPLLRQLLGPQLYVLVNNTLLRRQQPQGVAPPLPFHQDALFLGSAAPILNVWIPLQACGVDAPGLEVVTVPVPQVFVPPALPAGPLQAGMSYDALELPEAAVRATFPAEAFCHAPLATGEVWIFSQWSLHRTWLTPAMQGTRHSLEVRLTGQPQATLHTPLRPV